MYYDVSLHDLVDLVVIFETSPSSSKTDSECLSYCVFDVWGFIGSSCMEVSHLSPHNIFSLADPQYFQQNWFHPVWSSDAQVIVVLVWAVFLGSAVVPAPSPVVPASANAHR